MLLLDENLSCKLVARFRDAFSGVCCVAKVAQLGEGTADDKVWQYAKTNHLAILTKDKDFVDYWQRFGPPPKVVLLEVGNCRLSVLAEVVLDRRKEIIEFLASADRGLLVI